MEEDTQFVKPKEKKYNRRSSFFRRLSSYNSDSPTNIHSRSTLQVSQCSITSPQENKTTEYTNKLIRENEDWNELLTGKKREEDELNERSPEAAASVDFLTDADKKFLADRPDYTAIGRLLDSVTESVIIKQQRINNTLHKMNNLINHCERINSERTEDVINYFLEEYDELNEIAAPAS